MSFTYKRCLEKGFTSQQFENRFAHQLFLEPQKAANASAGSGKTMKCFVTGGAGFIGSNLVDRLLADGHHVVTYDNFSTGKKQFLEQASRHPLLRMITGDLLDRDRLNEAVVGSEFVFHLSANADVRFGTKNPERDLQQNT